MVKLENKIASEFRTLNYGNTTFGSELFEKLLRRMILTANEVDVDLLLVLKDEALIAPDCFYFSCLVVKNVIEELKCISLQSAESLIAIENYTVVDGIHNSNVKAVKFEIIAKNLIDVCRVLVVPEEEEVVDSQEDFLVDPSILFVRSPIAPVDESNNLDYYTDSSDDENAGKKKVTDMSDPDMALLAELSGMNKRKLKDNSSNSNKKPKRNRLSVQQQLLDYYSYRKVYSKLWLTLLTIPLTVTQHKLILKHIPENVLPIMTQPILLADYLTISYDQGGLVSVLALESLLQLIVQYNLDYPNYFVSLLNLCTIEIFTAKYRNKFVKLLSMSLQSTNLPIYLVAAFMKKLLMLSLHASSTIAHYCINQVALLLMQHPQCLVLLHQKIKVNNVDNNEKDKEDSDSSTVHTGKEKLQKLINSYVSKLSDSDVKGMELLKSSLWELEILESHHLHAVANLVNNIKEDKYNKERQPSVEEHFNNSYTDMIESTLIKSKGERKFCELAYQVPSTLFGDNSTITKMFK